MAKIPEILSELRSKGILNDEELRDLQLRVDRLEGRAGEGHHLTHVTSHSQGSHHTSQTAHHTSSGVMGELTKGIEGLEDA